MRSYNQNESNKKFVIVKPSYGMSPDYCMNYYKLDKNKITRQQI